MNIKGYESLDKIMERGTQPLGPGAFEAAANETGANAGTRAGRPDDSSRSDSTRVRVDDLETASNLREQAQAVSQEVVDMLRSLADAGVEPRTIDELRQLAAGIRASDFTGNPDILERETRLALELAERLELGLAGAVEDDRPGIRASADEDIAEQHREIVADYYRRLGSAGEEPPE